MATKSHAPRDTLTHGNGSGIAYANAHAENESVYDQQQIKVVHYPVADQHTDIKKNTPKKGTPAGTNAVLDFSSKHHRAGLAHNANSEQPS